MGLRKVEEEFEEIRRGRRERMRQQEVKVQLTLTEGYQERFTRACIKVAKRRMEGGSGRSWRKDAKKIAEAV